MKEANKSAVDIIYSSGFIVGNVYTRFLMIKNDLHMGDAKSALCKVNDAIKFIEEESKELLSRTAEENMKIIKEKS
jgi:hypothetical protein